MQGLRRIDWWKLASQVCSNHLTIRHAKLKWHVFAYSVFAGLCCQGRSLHVLMGDAWGFRCAGVEQVLVSGQHCAANALSWHHWSLLHSRPYFPLEPLSGSLSASADRGTKQLESAQNKVNWFRHHVAGAITHVRK